MKKLYHAIDRQSKHSGKQRHRNPMCCLGMELKREWWWDIRIQARTPKQTTDSDLPRGDRIFIALNGDFSSGSLPRRSHSELSQLVTFFFTWDFWCALSESRNKRHGIGWQLLSLSRSLSILMCPGLITTQSDQWRLLLTGLRQSEQILCKFSWYQKSTLKRWVTYSV